MKKAPDEPSELGWLIAGAIIVIALWLTTPTVISIAVNLGGGVLPERGQYGDQYGAVNALFTGLALLGLLYGGFQTQSALRQNSEALSISREELENTRKELRAAQEGLEEQRRLTDAQNARLREQQFDQTFFNLLRSCIDARESVRFGQSKGVDAILNHSKFIDHVLHECMSLPEENRGFLRQNRLNEEIFNRDEAGPTAFVDQATALIKYAYKNSRDKYGIYAQILRSAFSTSEIKILAAASVSRPSCQELSEIASEFFLFIGLNDSPQSIPRFKEILPSESLGLE